MKTATMNFDERVWNLCRKVPKGKVTTYKAIAEKLGTRAYRAVGGALHRNLNWPAVPCHRVVGSDGSLTGFGRGLKEKKRLLEQEGVKVTEDRVDLKKHIYRI
jgi:methylated-DNA-[protein]-cysteine S-methyltransferase